MELRQLEMLLSLVETGTYVQAGERLHVAHSAVHRQVRLLEEEMGQRLIYRDGRRLQLTGAGRGVVDLARRVLRDVQNLTLQLRENQELTSGRVLLGTGTTMFLYFFPRVLEVFRARYPGIEVQVMTGTATEVLASIREGSLDLGVVFTTHLPESEKTAIQFAPLYEEEFVLIVPESFSLANRKRLTIQELQGMPVITFSRTSRIREFIESQLAAAGVRMKVVMELENEEAIDKMVSINAGAAFISKRRARAEGFRFLTVKDLNLRANVSAVSSARIPMTRAARAFLATCLQVAGRH